jgi:RNA-directed DNA polymerase
MITKHKVARNLAAAFLSGTWSRRALLRRGTLACTAPKRSLRLLVSAVLAAFCKGPTDLGWKSLTAFIEHQPCFCADWRGYAAAGCLRQLFWVTPNMSPAAGPPATWSVPAWPTPTALADWLGIRPAELEWFADCHGHEANVGAGPLRHYLYRWIAKRSGMRRLLETPKPRLKKIQRRLLRELLDRIPPHEAVHGYCRGRSISTFAAPHCGRRIVLRFDLRHFFPAVADSRIHALFATAGYPREVARILTGLCTNVVPDDVWKAAESEEGSPYSWHDRRRFRYPHLPQGAPTSPALANLCAYRLDCRLHGLALTVGGQYTRYADDLAFSGDAELERSARRFQVAVCTVALEEGFEVHTRKSRFMRQGVRQQLVGVVVNAHVNVCRAKYDRLKAILHNCVRYGPNSQSHDQHADFRAHLQGQIAHVAMLNPSRGERLKALFYRICWDEIESV